MQRTSNLGKERLSQIPPFGLRMPSDVRLWVEEQASASDRSINYVIVRFLRERMEASASAAATGERLDAKTPAAAE